MSNNTKKAVEQANQLLKAAKAAVSWLDHANCCNLPSHESDSSMRGDMNKLRDAVWPVGPFQENTFDSSEVKLSNRIFEAAKKVCEWMGDPKLPALPDDGELGSMQADMGVLQEQVACYADSIGSFQENAQKAVLPKWLVELRKAHRIINKLEKLVKYYANFNWESEKFNLRKDERWKVINEETSRFMELLESDDWISVKDAIPKPLEGRQFSEAVLVVNMDSAYPNVTISDLNFYPGENVWRGCEPTHWMPLPALPKNK